MVSRVASGAADPCGPTVGWAVGRMGGLPAEGNPSEGAEVETEGRPAQQLNPATPGRAISQSSAWRGSANSSASPSTRAASAPDKGSR